MQLRNKNEKEKEKDKTKQTKKMNNSIGPCDDL